MALLPTLPRMDMPKPRTDLPQVSSTSRTSSLSLKPPCNHRRPSTSPKLTLRRRHHHHKRQHSRAITTTISQLLRRQVGTVHPLAHTNRHRKHRARAWTTQTQTTGGLRRNMRPLLSAPYMWATLSRLLTHTSNRLTPSRRHHRRHLSTHTHRWTCITIDQHHLSLCTRQQTSTHRLSSAGVGIYRLSLLTRKLPTRSKRPHQRLLAHRALTSAARRRLRTRTSVAMAMSSPTDTRTGH